MEDKNFQADYDSIFKYYNNVKRKIRMTILGAIGLVVLLSYIF